MPCRYAETPGDGTATMLGAGIDTTWLPELPHAVAVFLMLRIVGAEYEFEERCRVEVRLAAPDRNETTVLEFGVEDVKASPLRSPGMDMAVLVPTVAQWEAEEYGLYTLEVFVQGTRQHRRPSQRRPPKSPKPSSSPAATRSTRSSTIRRATRRAGLACVRRVRSCGTWSQLQAPSPYRFALQRRSRHRRRPGRKQGAAAS